MNVQKKVLSMLAALAIVAVFSVGSAFAVNYGGVDSGLNLDTYIGSLGTAGIGTVAYDGNPALTDYTWDVTFLGSEAGNYNLVFDGSVIFDNIEANTPVGSMAYGLDMANVEFKDQTDGETFTIAADLLGVNFMLLEVTSAGTYQGVNYKVGDLIIGFNDNLAAPDADYDDIVLLARPTPIPGAVWLMGSGLLGLVGVRRRMMKRS